MKIRLEQCTNAILNKLSHLFGNERLRQQNDFLEAQIQVLLEICPNANRHLTESHRRNLVESGMPIRDSLHKFSLIVQPETILKWHRRLKAKKWTFPNRSCRIGRPRVLPETESLVIRLAEENTWGSLRIVGELKKFGHPLCRETVSNILRRHGLPTIPTRKGPSWKQFIASHIDTAWATDFFTEEVWHQFGLITCYVLFFIHLRTRRVYIANVTEYPNTEWIQQQTRNFRTYLEETGIPCKYLIHDNDRCFIPMDDLLEKTSDIEPVKTPPHAPQANAYAERFVREVRETLDNLILVGEGSLYRTMKKIERHHNFQRPHQGLANRIPAPFHYPNSPAPPESVLCHSEIPGLLHHYFVKLPASSAA